MLLQFRLVCKAQEVCASLSVDQSLDYDVVRATVLLAFELVPREILTLWEKGQPDIYEVCT